MRGCGPTTTTPRQGVGPVDPSDSLDPVSLIFERFGGGVTTRPLHWPRGVAGSGVSDPLSKSQQANPRHQGPEFVEMWHIGQAPGLDPAGQPAQAPLSVRRPLCGHSP